MGKYQVLLNKALCKSCEICVELCPKKVFGIDKTGKAEVVNAENCIGCLICEEHCPDFCMEVREK